MIYAASKWDSELPGWVLSMPFRPLIVELERFPNTSSSCRPCAPDCLVETGDVQGGRTLADRNISRQVVLRLHPKRTQDVRRPILLHAPSLARANSASAATIFN